MPKPQPQLHPRISTATFSLTCIASTHERMNETRPTIPPSTKRTRPNPGSQLISCRTPPPHFQCSVKDAQVFSPRPVFDMRTGRASHSCSKTSWKQLNIATYVPHYAGIIFVRAEHHRGHCVTMLEFLPATKKDGLPAVELYERHHGLGQFIVPISPDRTNRNTSDQASLNQIRFWQQCEETHQLCQQVRGRSATLCFSPTRPIDIREQTKLIETNEGSYPSSKIKICYAEPSMVAWHTRVRYQYRWV